MNFRLSEMEGGQVLLVDKPLGYTSFGVVKKLKWAGGFRKIGHAGTLDPLATGLLICCTGPMTRQIEGFQLAEKEYTGVLELGRTTPSFDLETDFSGNFPTDHLSSDRLHAEAAALTGLIEQTPPLYSAVKIDGQRAYRAARQGHEAIVPPRNVEIKVFEIDPSDFPRVAFRVVCSKGTYIRSLARDFGLRCGSGAYLQSLCRTRIGEFRLDDARSLREWVQQLRPEADFREEKRFLPFHERH